MPEDKTFVDTNIIIYAYDVTAGNKHKIAGGIFADLWNSGLGVISTQVLQEFFVNVVQKIPRLIAGFFDEGYSHLLRRYHHSDWARAIEIRSPLSPCTWFPVVSQIPHPLSNPYRMVQFGRRQMQLIGC